MLAIVISCTSTPGRPPTGSADRARAADRLWDIDTGHDLMITEPGAVADLLLRLVPA